MNDELEKLLVLNGVLERLNRRRQKHRITDIEFEPTYNRAVRMNIDGIRYRINLSDEPFYFVEQVGTGVLSTNDSTRRITKELMD